MLNYHELTMNEPRDSPQRRKQFLVISAIMTGMAIHAGLNAGVLASLSIETGTFPGGEFVHKSMTKDYAASTGTLRTVADDLGIAEEGNTDLVLQEGTPRDTADLLYSLFLDDVSVVPGGKTRFAAGALLSGNNKGGNGDMKKLLLEVNKRINDNNSSDDSDSTHSKDVKYEVGKLPKVEAAVAQHPFTAGAWSAILQSYKIIPKFKKYAQENSQEGSSLVVIATCSAKQQMCTYYMPLTKRDKFYMDKPTTDEYAKEFEHVSTLQRLGIDFGDTSFSIGGINLGNVFRGAKKAIGLGGKSKSSSDEL